MDIQDSSPNSGTFYPKNFDFKASLRQNRQAVMQGGQPPLGESVQNWFENKLNGKSGNNGGGAKSPDLKATFEKNRQALMQPSQGSKSVGGPPKPKADGGNGVDGDARMSDDDWDHMTVQQLLSMSDEDQKKLFAHLSIRAQQDAGKLLKQMKMEDRLRALANMPVEQQEAVMREMGVEEQKKTYDAMSDSMKKALMAYERMMDRYNDLQRINDRTLQVLKKLAEPYGASF